MSTPTTAPRRRWVWAAIIAAAVLLVAGGIGLGLVYGGRSAEPAPQSPAEPTNPQTPSTPASTTPPALAGVDGCLGGDSRGPQAVLDAQAAAPQTPEGAVSYAIAFSRWAAQKPVVPDEEISELDGVAVRDVPNLAESLKTSEQFEQAQFHVTSLNGYYRINTFDDARVELTLMLPLVVQGAIDPTLNYMPSYTVEWSERGWVITGSPEVDDANTLRTTGVAVSGGC
jgi:hypothetical protein